MSNDTTGQPNNSKSFPTIDLFKKDGKIVSAAIDVFKFLEKQKNMIANCGSPVFRTDDSENRKEKK